MKKKKQPLRGLLVRDMKTGRFAFAWKAERWPDRFHFRRRAVGEKGIEEVDAELAVVQKFRKKEAALTKTQKKVRAVFIRWAQQGELLNWYFLKNITAAKDRFRKNFWVVEVGYSGKKAGRDTPETIHFTVDLETGKIEKN